MIRHLELGNTGFKRSKQLKKLIDEGKIQFAGNRKLRIYGALSCSSGKRMKVENRVFFKSAEEAIKEDYRPCGHCMHEEYLQWKKLKN